MTQTIAEQFSEFATQLHFDDLPDEVIQVAKRCIVDGTSAIIAGSTEPSAQILRKYAQAGGGHPEASTLGHDSLRVPIQMAALINGTAGHAHDWDDTALSKEPDRTVLIHPTMQPLCSSYAVAEMLGSSGNAFLSAFVAGFEVQVKIAEAIGSDHFTGKRGFHTSGTIGVFGSTIAAAKLMELNAYQMANALAIVATMASGIGSNHGSMAKPLNMGLASESGVAAARMAGLGLTGKLNSLETGRGFFEAFGGGFNSKKIENRLGKPFAILDPGTSIKPYPCGVVGHPGMDAMLDLVVTHDLTPEEVAEIQVKTGENTIAPGPLRIKLATNALEGKFCVPFQMATILIRRKAGMAEFTDEFVCSEKVQDLQRKVKTYVDPEIVKLGKEKLIFDITVRTHDGRVLNVRSPDIYRGGPLNPLSKEELNSKFYDASSKILNSSKQTSFFQAVEKLEEMNDIKCLIESLI